MSTADQHKRRSKARSHSADIISVEVQFPETSEAQLEVLIDFLTELLAEERLREFENMELNHGQ